MSQLDHLVRDVERALPEGEAAVRAVLDKYRPEKRKGINPKRRTPRKWKTVVRLTGEAKKELRRQVFARSGGVCEVVKSPECEKWADWHRGELYHITSRGACGDDTPENNLWSCKPCHQWHHNGGKPCKAKSEL